jgi:hypothetical protein
MIGTTSTLIAIGCFIIGGIAGRTPGATSKI